MAKKPLEINSIEDSNPSRSSVLRSKLKEWLQKARIFLQRFNPKKFKESSKKVKIATIVTSILLLLLIILAVVLVIFKPKKESQTIPVISKEKKTDEISSELLKSLPRLKPDLSEVKDQDLNSLIIKANMLYANGDKKEALSVFDRINIFSQSLASYNLGVMQVEQKDYQAALNTFDRSINIGEDVSLSALNAAISARYMGDLKQYDYYLDLATRTLPAENKRPFYSYLYALVSFYNQNYFASLSGINNPSAQSYVPESASLGAKVYLVFNDNEHAIQSLEKANQEDRDLKNLGLLYARVGDYENAQKNLSAYREKNPEDIEAAMAQQIIALKTGDFASARDELEFLLSHKKEKIAQHIFPIKVILQPRLFDIDSAQKQFIKTGLGHRGKLADRLLFYYAPFKVFDARESLEILKQSGILSGYDRISSEEKVLQSQTLTQINEDITQALIAVYHSDLREALKLLKKSINSNPNHSILHYNIGLLYAQMGDYENAYKHFLRSYYLDVKRVDAGLFAILAARITNKDLDRIKVDITQDLDHLALTQDQRSFFFSFLSYLDQGSASDFAWIQKVKNPLAIYYALKASYGLQAEDYSGAYNAFADLSKIHHNDLVTSVMMSLTENPLIGPKQVALKLHQIIARKEIFLPPIFYGPELSREFYIYAGFISGTLKNQEDLIRDKLIASRGNHNGILQLLGLLCIYQHRFDEALVIYDELTHKLGEDNSRTQFLYAVSAVGTGNYDNATLSLQLSKMESDSSYETRLVLGMLYQQAGDFKAAASHYNMLIDKSFNSEYFDFVIDEQKVLGQYLARENQ